MSSTTDQIILALTRIPYAEQISAVKVEPCEVRFTWRGDRFRVSSGGKVETVEGSFLVSGNLAILMERILTKAIIDAEIRNEAEIHNPVGHG